jgi:micrococcal nuclease
MFSKFSFIAVIALLLATIALPVYAQELTGTIISVGDGDTFRAKVGNETVTVRLACIDAPETGQSPWGKQSADTLKQLLPTGQSINIRTVEKDKYGRTVAEIFKDNQSVNLQMVTGGHAVVYRQYLKGCADNQNQFLQAEATAKKQRLAFWNQDKPVMPWDFRRSAQKPSQTPQQQCEPSYPDVCIPKNSRNLKCSDISQRKFRVLPPDTYGFDRDGDGIGCER